MFLSDKLNNHLKTSSTINSNTRVLAEWNCNQPDNIEKLGNYRYRPGSIGSQFSSIMNVYDPIDSGKFYTGATDSDITVDGGFDDNNNPVMFVSKKEKMQFLYSLEDCIKPNRPRSGINKLLYLGISGATDYSYNQYIDDISRIIAKRPRYFLSSKDDSFKYWTSFRYEDYENTSTLRGVSKPISAGDYFIDDACPFVVYKNSIVANRIVVKAQTNVGEQSINSIRIGQNTVEDPLYGYNNSTTPKRWRIEVLKNNVWMNAVSFDENSVRKNGEKVFGPDGYVEISYGVNIPDTLKDIFIFAEEISNTALLPDEAPIGYAYLVKFSNDDVGRFFVYTEKQGGLINNWDDFVPTYTWNLYDEELNNNSHVVTKFSDPNSFLVGKDRQYREFDTMRGVRIVVDTMNKSNCPFDLIEISPRIVADVSDYTMSFEVTKTLSDMGNTSLPLGNMIASVGSVEFFDTDYSFNENNKFNHSTGEGSVIASLLDTVMKVTFWDVVRDVDRYDYFIPIKTLYSQGFPQVSDQGGTINIQLRDLFYFFESEKAVPMLLTDISLSYAVTVLLDNIGFSNYVFKRVENEKELIIPFFFVSPEENVATVLQNLALATQSAMFFDEYNNLIVMSKNYVLPQTEDERKTDLSLLGQEVDGNLPNIINLSSQEKKVFNSGIINYTNRYINRSIGSIEQALYVNEYQEYVYKPSLLWEVSGRENRQAINDLAPEGSGFSLAAVPLSTSLSASLPYVSSNVIYNNAFDLGQNVYWLQSFSGYMYSGGEVIKYDAIEYSVAGVGKVWISSNTEYQDYISKLIFNGKMYPTGLVRIWTEPRYYTKNNITYMVDGTLEEGKHGRGQFATKAVSHNAGIPANSTWLDNSYIKGCIQDTKKYLFSMNNEIIYPQTRGVGDAGKIKYISGKEVVATEYAKASSRSGIIKNFLANKNDSESPSTYTLSTNSGSVQASALVFNGPKEIPSDLRQADLVSYIYKPLEDRFSHFGTRMRIIGKIESGTNNSQTPLGGYPLLPSDYVTPSNPSQSNNVLGGSGGIGVGVNPTTNNGYFFEIVSLTSENVSGYTNNGAETPYTISKYPNGTVTTVVNDLVTVTTEQINNFAEGDDVVISGLIDNNRKTLTNTPVNGEFEVTGVSTNRKTFTYNLPIPSVTSLSVSSASGDGQYITYTTSENHDFRSGQLVTISGNSNSNFNKTSVPIHSISGDQGETKIFKIAATDTGGGAGGTVTYVPLNTQCWNGGIATKSSDEELNIDNIFFYKVVSGSNESEVIKYKRENNIVTITTLNPHSFVNGEKVTISDVNSSVNGTFEIIIYPTEKQVSSGGVESTIITTDRTFCFSQIGSNIAEVTLSTLGKVVSNNPSAITEILWKGTAKIIVDDGKFTGQTRFVTTENPTVYDLAVETVDIGDNRRQFFLYINGKRVSVVDDKNALPKYTNMALFVRGSSNCMFENVYALGNNYAQETGGSLQLPISDVFGDENDDLDSNESLERYAVSGLIQQTYLSGISSQEQPKYKIYFDEFGTIMREMAYFNVKYDRAYPALIAKLAPTLNKTKGYSVSGFYAGPYNAEFLIFNCVDKNLNLGDTTGNYLRIHGITFTQNTTRTLTVDDYFEKVSNLSDPVIEEGTILMNPEIEKKVYDTIKQSRMKYGRSEFTLDNPYIQTSSAAEEMLGWIIKKVMVPRKNVGINVFGVNTLQLGDIVTINYKRDGIDVVDDEKIRFVIYNMTYNKSVQGATHTVYMTEV